MNNEYEVSKVKSLPGKGLVIGLLSSQDIGAPPSCHPTVFN